MAVYRIEPMRNPADSNWKVLDRASELARPPWLEVFREKIELPSGRTVDDFYTVEMQDFAVVAALTERREVVIERLYRRGADQMTWSLPAGYVHSNETPLEAIQREMSEETGYEASEWLEMGRFIVDGNRGCGWCYCFAATGARLVHTPRSDDLAEVEVSVVPWDRLLELLATGEITELASAAAIGLAALRLDL